VDGTPLFPETWRRDSAPNFLLIFSRQWSAAVDPLNEIDKPNNSKHDNDRGDAEAEHEPDIMPGHALSSLARWYYRAQFRTLGRTHGAFPISDVDRSFCNRFSRFPVPPGIGRMRQSACC
jgi:hypothetical protein